ncbi:2-octaprenyl-3-methyl-6-methoxy-1,4-benzoquinol hydroxylase [Vibrio variabilis]|uniref:2-octaprenyl-3-methyl-6-methoxy-1,4-benzoquinol hydroxylase n=1 Tax=Vibrio variabilis TaxID=990271 RepID=A0ABQ0JGK4_9VIBR|nr:2-octaprenyl-3-methyl-6-methoxy-1,4-benzoquinol hydroxylase [Vibrio variabilis]
MQSFDIAIVGGGMVGLALARALKNTGIRIAIVEGSQPSKDLSGDPDIRVSALSRASETILKNLDAWEAIQNHRCAPYQAMEVWEQDSFARIEFSASQMSQPNLGHIVENRVIQLALLEQVEQQSNVTLFMPHRCQSMAIGESEVWTTLDNGQSLRANSSLVQMAPTLGFVSSKIFL